MNARKKDDKASEADAAEGKKNKKLKRRDYEKELERLHGELVAMQDWVVQEGLKICVRR